MRYIKYNEKIIPYKPKVYVNNGVSMNKKIELENLSLFCKFANKHNIQYSPIYGTLLGIIRDNDLLSHDEDVDIGIFAEDYDKIFENIGELLKLGFVITRYEECGFMTLTRKNNYIDFYSFKKEGKYRQACNAYYYPSVFFDTLTNVNFKGIAMYILSVPGEVLQFEYGETWKTSIVRTASKKEIIISTMKARVKLLLPKKLAQKLTYEKDEKTRAKYIRKCDAYYENINVK